MVATAKKTSRADRQTNRALYAPKVVAKAPKPPKEAPDMVALRKLTSKVLDSLKNPSAIPSQIILAALVQARTM